MNININFKYAFDQIKSKRFANLEARRRNLFVPS